MQQSFRLLISKSALNVSGDKFVHPQEHFLTYIQLLVKCTVIINYNYNLLQYIVPKAVHTVKKCS